MVLIGLIAFIVPVFVKVFADFGGELPMITKFTVALSNLVTAPLVRADRAGHRRPDRASRSGARPRPAASSGTASA